MRQYMAIATEVAPIVRTQMCPKTGELEDSQYRWKYWVPTAVKVMATRTKQY